MRSLFYFPKANKYHIDISSSLVSLANIHKKIMNVTDNISPIILLLQYLVQFMKRTNGVSLTGLPICSQWQEQMKFSGV